MLTPVNSFSNTTALSLLSTNRSDTSSISSKGGMGSTAQAVTGNTDDVFKAGTAIGKIMEIVAGMKGDDVSLAPSAGQRVYNRDGSYSETSVGQHPSDINDKYAIAARAQGAEASMNLVKKQAEGTGPEADRAKALLKAVESGTLEEIDMTPMGVTVTATVTKHFDAEGNENGMSGTWDVRGLKDFMDSHTYLDDGGQRRDKATGKYANFASDGNKYTYVLY